MITNRTIASVTTGHRLIMGTKHPVECFVNREVRYGKVRWILQKGCCNGTSEGAVTFLSRKDALEALNEYK